MTASCIKACPRGVVPLDYRPTLKKIEYSNPKIKCFIVAAVAASLKKVSK
jgi:hypothetical protein